MQEGLQDEDHQREDNLMSSFRFSPESRRRATLALVVRHTPIENAIMSNCIVMIPSDTAGASLSSPAYATVEDALQGARFLLDSGAESAWIVDSDGGILLPAEQVLSRLGAMNGQSNALIKGKRDETHKFQPILPS